MNRVNPISLIGDICLIAFLLPGHASSFEGNVGYHIALGLFQPGWCRMEINPPDGSNVIPGIFLQVSLSWGFLFLFVLTRIIRARTTPRDSWQQEYHRTMRRARY